MRGGFDPEEIERVRQATDILAVVGEHVKLKRSGKSWVGLCPFHQEKTPSFHVDPVKGLFHCFGCGAGGNVFTFLMRAEGLSFAEAARKLAARAGIELATTERQERGRRSRLLSLLAEAASFYHTVLMSEEGEEARRYLEGRGLPREAWETWTLGFSPRSRDASLRHLLARGFRHHEVMEAGLVHVVEGGLQDRFAGRVVFPVRNLSGEIVGFGGRLIAGEGPKYLNSPESSVYHKARLLYGLDRAKAWQARKGRAVVAEGYLDAIALHLAGVNEAVATCGTALGLEHLRTLRRFSDRVVLAFDADEAGALAAERGLGLGNEVGVDLAVAEFPPGRDPAALLAEEGPEALAERVERARPLVQFVLDRIVERRSGGPEGKARAAREGAAALATCPDPLVREEYALYLAERLGARPEQVLSLVNRALRGERVEAERVATPAEVRLEKEALRALLLSEEGDDLSRELEEEDFALPEARRVFRALRTLGRDGLLSSLHEQEEVVARLVSELLLAEGPLAPRETLLRLQEKGLRQKISSLRTILEKLNPLEQGERYRVLFSELMDLELERRRVLDEISKAEGV